MLKILFFKISALFNKKTRISTIVIKGYEKGFLRNTKDDVIDFNLTSELLKVNLKDISINKNKLIYDVDCLLKNSNEEKKVIKKISSNQIILQDIMYIKHYIILKTKPQIINNSSDINIIEKVNFKISSKIKSIKIECYLLEHNTKNTQTLCLLAEKYIVL